MMMQDHQLDSMSKDEFVKEVLKGGQSISVKDFEIFEKEGGEFALVLMSGNNTVDLCSESPAGGRYYRLDSTKAKELTTELHKKTRGKIPYEDEPLPSVDVIEQEMNR